jgi:hypothetical protein
MSNPSFICPAPLVVAAKHIYTTIVVAGDCVVPCPTIVFTHLEWKTMTNVLNVVVYVSIILSFLSFIAHLTKFKKFFIQVMLIGGFFLNALGMFMFTMHNKNNFVICDGPSHYIERAPSCVIQASTFTFSFLWVEAWSAIFVVDLYLHVTSRVTSHDVPMLRNRYLAFAILTTTFLTILPLAAGNFGFDPETAIPFCSYFLSDNTHFFWYSFIIPMTVLILIDVWFALLVMVRLNQVFVNKNWFLADADEGTPTQISGRYMLRQSSNLEMHESMASEDLQEQYRQKSTMYYEEHGQFSDQSVEVLSEVMTISTTATSRPGTDISASSVSRRRQNFAYTSSFCDGDSLTAPMLRPASFLTASVAVSAGADAASPVDTTNPMLNESLATSLNADSFSLEPHGKAGLSSGPVGENAYLWLRYLRGTWRYNRLTIMFVVIFCFSSLVVLPLIVNIYHTTWHSSVQGAQDFASCLVQASVASQSAGVEQTQAAVDSYCEQICGEHPANRPNVTYVSPPISLYQWYSALECTPVFTDMYGCVLILYCLVVLRCDDLGMWLWYHSCTHFRVRRLRDHAAEGDLPTRWAEDAGLS